MNKVDMIVKAPYVFTMKGTGVGFEEDTAIVIKDGKIVAIDNWHAVDREYTADEIIVMDGHAIFPGFIDAHMHTPVNIMRGLAQDTRNWMMFGLQPFDNATNDDERDAGSNVGIIEAIKAGTTTLGDYDYKMDKVCEFIMKIGARGNITQTIRSAKRKIYKPSELYEFDKAVGEESLARNIELYDKWHNKDHGRIKILFGPQGADFMDAELLLKIRKIAKERKTKIHIHTQQGKRETYQIEKRYGMKTIDWLEKIGFMDSDMIAVHLADCNDEEAARVAKSGATMIVCPGSIGIIDGVVCPSVAFQEAGGSCALGSDQSPGNNCHNIINEMKNVALFNKIKFGNSEIMPAWKALRMATIEGAKVLGLDDDIGSLEVGKKADLIAINLNFPSMLPVYTYPMRNIVPNLVYSARGEEVDLVVVDGRVIMKDRKFTLINENDYIDAVKKYPEKIGKRAAKEFFEIDGTNSHFMKEGKL